MNRFALALSILCLAAPLQAQDAAPPADQGDVDQGLSLIERGTQLLLRGLMAEMEPALRDMQKGLDEAMTDIEPALRDLATLLGDIRNYEAPVRLPNGDILIRRKADAPFPEPGRPGPDSMPEPGPGGEIEL